MLAETDLIWMTLLVFLPSLFALGLIFFPRGWERAMCWWSLAGTALTLGVSIAIFINFKNGVLDRPGAESDRQMRLDMSLDRRTAEAAASERAGVPRLADDYVSRYDWIRRFNIEYRPCSRSWR
jgi:NADH-quinone oxidoreductase subunit M